MCFKQLSILFKDVHRYTRSGLFLNTVITNVTCKGDEESLSQCQFDRNIFQELDYSVVNCGKGWQLESQFVGVSCTKGLYMNNIHS